MADRKQFVLALSYIPLGTPVSVADSPEPPDVVPHLIGGFAGLGLADGEDVINVKTKGAKVGVKLDDAVSITILLPGAAKHGVRRDV